LHDALLGHGFERCTDCYDEDAARAGDIALFRFQGAAQHVAILSSKDSIIHAFAPAKKVVETGLGTTWQTRCLGLYR
jgi:cell wall-associated NlpC family hydrolase